MNALIVISLISAIDIFSNNTFIFTFMSTIDVSAKRGRTAQQPNRPRAAVNRVAPTQASQPNQPAEPAPSASPIAVATDSNNPHETGIGYKNLLIFLFC